MFLTANFVYVVDGVLAGQYRVRSMRAPVPPPSSSSVPMSGFLPRQACIRKICKTRYICLRRHRLSRRQLSRSQLNGQSLSKFSSNLCGHNNAIDIVFSCFPLRVITATCLLKRVKNILRPHQHFRLLSSGLFITKLLSLCGARRKKIPPTYNSLGGSGERRGLLPSVCSAVRGSSRC